MPYLDPGKFTAAVMGVTPGSSVAGKKSTAAVRALIFLSRKR
jgi:hypothetical protein